MSEPTQDAQYEDGAFTKQEEEGWYFYLGEVAMRWVENRIFHSMYSTSSVSNDLTTVHAQHTLPDLAKAVGELEFQLDQWSFRPVSELIKGMPQYRSQ